MINLDLSVLGLTDNVNTHDSGHLQNFFCVVNIVGLFLFDINTPASFFGGSVNDCFYGLDNFLMPTVPPLCLKNVVPLF